MSLSTYIIWFYMFLVNCFCFAAEGWLNTESYSRIVPQYIPEYMIKPALRISNYPFITGDTFRSFSNFILDEINLPFDPLEVQPGDIIFISSHPEVLREFFTHHHHKIQNKYIIISHNDDPNVPGEFKNYLDDEKIIAWFSKNIDQQHPKLIPIPIGIPNPIWVEFGFCSPDLFIEAMKTIPSWEERPGYFVYLNITVAANRPGRNHVVNYFKNKKFCVQAPKKSGAAYLSDLKKYKFVISPPGNGVDCFRTWEALLMGSIPIVQHSTLDPLFEDLPVILIDQWEEVTEEFLEKQYNSLKPLKFNREKLFMDYWLKKINSYK